jgi:hypothetical protein
MAQDSRTLTFKNATINTHDWTITEFSKEETKTYDLKEILNNWSDIDGLNFSLKQVDELPTIDETAQNGEDE